MSKNQALFVTLVGGLLGEITWARVDDREGNRRIATFSMNVLSAKKEPLMTLNSLCLLDSVDDEGNSYIDIGSMSTKNGKGENIYAVTFLPGRRNASDKKMEAEYRRMTNDLATAVADFVRVKDEEYARRMQVRQQAPVNPIATQLKNLASRRQNQAQTN